jgi:hypothetical protein
MPKLIDISGQRFNRWLVIDIAKRVDRRYYWNCICSCGTKRVVAGSALRSGHSPSCGCITKYRIVDIVGVKFNYLTVLRRVANNLEAEVMWLCKCDCGNEVVVRGSHLKTGNTKSCGCLQKRHISKLGKSMVTHGMTMVEPLYQVWRNMLGRCSSNSTTRSCYFDRGIRVCEEWREDPRKFVEWALSNGYKEGLELDRIDNDKGYYQENCRFVTRLVNSHNKRTLMSTNTSGYAGVFKRSDTGKFQASLSHLGADFRLGCYATPWEACEARNNFIKENNLPHRIQEKL